ncbi:MAG TPA: hypothetical protein VFM18_17980 [Methanosarcina sp.]|nr:hypothetical protein [Methanosarcina sp.]
MKYDFKAATKKYFEPLVWVAAFIFLVYEAWWNWSEKQLTKLGAFRIVRAVENKIRALPPYPSLAIFLLPDLVLVPAKIFAMDYIGHGHIIIGVGIIMIAKFAGVALFAYLFSLTKESLMQIGWFVKVYNFVTKYRDKIHAYLNSWEFYQNVKAKVRAMVAEVKSWGKGE